MKRGKFLAILMATMIALAPAAAFADELMDLMELEELLFTEIAEVESTGFFKVKKSKAPGYSTIIAAQTIQNSSARTLADVLETFAPGVSIATHEKNGKLIGMRGMTIDNNQKTSVMFDGQSLNHRTGAGYSNELDLPLLGDIAKVEVINGPGAMVHGSGAISGFVNMIPKNGSDFPGFSAKVEGGYTEQSYTAELGYGMSYGEAQDLYVYAGFTDSRGVKADGNEWDPWDYYNSSKSNYDVSGYDQYYEMNTNHSMLVKGNTDPSYKAMLNWRHGEFKLKAYFTEVHTLYNSAVNRFADETWPEFSPEGVFLDESYPVHPAGTLGDNKQGYHTATMALSPQYTFNLSDTESVEVRANLDWMHHWYDRMDGDGSNTTGYSMSQRNGAKEQHSDIKVTGRTERLENLHLAVGAQVGRREYNAGKLFFHTPLDGSDEGEDATWRESSMFTEAVYDVTDKWLVSAGVRYDHVKYTQIKTLSNAGTPSSQDKTTHRFATAYEIDDTSSVKLSYQEGFRVPDVTYYHYVDFFSDELEARGQERLPNLDIEEMSSTEFNISKAFDKINLDVDLNLYYNEYSKTLFWHDYYNDSSSSILDQAMVQHTMGYGTWQAALGTGDGAQEYWMGAMVNAPGKFRTGGAELIMNYKPTEKMNLNFIYGYSTPMGVDDPVNNTMFISDSAKSSLIRFPTHSVKLNWTAYWLKEKLLTYIGYSYASGYPTGKTDSSKLNWIYGQSRHIVDLAFAYKFTENFSTKLTVKNLFEHSVPRMTYYGEPNSGAYGEENRFIYLTFDYSF